MVLKTIDVHVGGSPVRVLVEGFPAPRGQSMAAKREWAARSAGAIRRALMLEPRGHRDMLGAVLTLPTADGSHAGVLFMDADGFPALSGHGIIGVVAVALEHRLLDPGSNQGLVRLDTPVGTVRATAEIGSAGRCEGTTVRFENVPSFVEQGGVAVMAGSRRLRVDIAYGGAFFAIVDAEAAGVPLDGAHAAELQRAGKVIAQAVNTSHPVSHPDHHQPFTVEGTIFTAPARHEPAALRQVMVSADGRIDRSASGSGTSAVMAVLDAMGLLDEEQPFVAEGIVGTALSGRVIQRCMVGEHEAVVTELQGRVWSTGEHTFLVSPGDPLREGLRLG